MAKMMVHKHEGELPEPGYARDEEIKRRADVNDQVVEEFQEKHEIHAIDPKVFEKDREILYHLDSEEITGRRADLHYCWVNFGGYGRSVKRKLAQGWFVITGDMPEALELKAPDGTRRWGDVMLMAVPQARYEEQLRYMEKLQKDVENKEVNNLRNLANRYSKLGVKIYSTEAMSEDNLDRLQKKAEAQRRANTITNTWVREGRVPGMRRQ
jgi:hypothetical protein